MQGPKSDSPMSNLLSSLTPILLVFLIEGIQYGYRYTY